MSGSKFTPETRGGLLERIAAGLSLADAAREVGVREKTVKGWLTRGRKEDTGPYAQFASAVQKAREAAKSRPVPMDEAELAQVVSQMARSGSVQAAKLRWEMLQSSDPEAVPVDEFDELKARRARRAAE